VIDPNASVVTFAVIDSTNLEAARRASRGESAPVWIVAQEQSGGRGRRGKSWASPQGNLFATYLAPGRRSPSEVALLSFAAALAVADLVDAMAGDAVARVKWPNDVLVHGRKISGILLEAGEGWFAIGIGINVTSAPFVEQRTISLAELSPNAPPITAKVFHALRERLVHWSARLEGDGFEDIRRCWTDRAARLGERAEVALGRETASGMIEGLGADGALLLRLDDGALRRISAGEVLFPSEGS
jgi:BirA family transcriptional regulator, biotin operon repressor / biotin---[acetyl-CoA-carboxylase] ligase